MRSPLFLSLSLLGSAELTLQLGAGSAGQNLVQPINMGDDVTPGDYLDGVTGFQRRVKAGYLAVDPKARCLSGDVGVNLVGEVKRQSTGR